MFCFSPFRVGTGEKGLMPPKRLWFVGFEDIKNISFIWKKVFNSGFNSSTLIYLHTHTVLIYTNILMCMCEHMHVHKHTHTLRQVSRNLSLPLLDITVVLIFPYPTLLLIYCSYPTIMLRLFDHVFNRTFI